jgi:hypothetical protein
MTRVDLEGGQYHDLHAQVVVVDDRLRRAIPSVPAWMSMSTTSRVLNARGGQRRRRWRLAHDPRSSAESSARESRSG